MQEFSGDFIKSDKGKPVSVSGPLKYFRTEGVEAALARTEASVHSNGRTRRVGEMIVKRVDDSVVWDERQHDAWPELVLEKYTWLKTHGLPVVPTLRIDPENNRILMTDVTEGQTKIIVDKHHRLKEGMKIRNRRQLIKELPEIAERAFAEGNGVYLDADAYSIVVDRDGRGKIFLLDIGLRTKRVHGGLPTFTFGTADPLTLEDAVTRTKEFLLLADIASLKEVR